MSRGFSNVSKLRRKLRKIDPEATRGVKKAVERAAQAIEADAIGNVPIDEGDLQRSISYKVGRDGFSAIIGPGVDRATIRSKGLGGATMKFTRSGALTSATIKDKDARFQLSKGLWVEFGTKSNDSGKSMPPRPFMQPAFDVNKGWAVREIREAISDALESAGNE